MKSTISFLIFIMLLISCDIESRKPEFKNIENIQVKNISSQNIEITADAIVFNPNIVSAYLLKTEIDIFANDIKVSHISQTENTEILKKAKFKIPLKADFKLTDLLKDDASVLEIINSSLKTFTDKKIKLEYIGTATFKVAGISFEVPIDYENDIEI